MDITLIWFPITKFILTIGLSWTTYYLYNKGKKKWATFQLVLLAIVWLFNPIKYDGTNIKDNHIMTEQERTIQYRRIREDSAPVYTKKLSFEERLKAEEEYSRKANQKVKDEIID